MTLKELARRIEKLIEEDVYRGDAIVTFGPRNLVVQELNFTRAGGSSLVVAQLSDEVSPAPEAWRARNFDPRSWNPAEAAAHRASGPDGWRSEFPAAD